MGYRIEYRCMSKVRGVEKRKSNLLSLTGLFLLTFFLLVYSFWPSGKAVFRGLIFSACPDVSPVAFNTLADDLKDGESLSDALTDFCLCVLGESEIAADS